MVRENFIFGIEVTHWTQLRDIPICLEPCGPVLGKILHLSFVKDVVELRFPWRYISYPYGAKFVRFAGICLVVRPAVN